MERTTSQETLQARESELRALLLRGLDGDARAYRAFLGQLSGHLRGFLRPRLSHRVSWKTYCRRYCWPYTMRGRPIAPNSR